MELNRGLAFGAGVLLLGLAWPAAAHNGAVAIAVPVEGIKIDGELSDWPEGMRRYPIALPEDRDKPKGPQDFQGDFRIGYNALENALYVAVEVRDESVVKETPGAANFDTQDGCEIYVDVGHKEEDVPVFQCVIWGNTRVADPSKRYGAGALADVKVEVQWGPKGYSYEWRIDVGQLSKGQAHLTSGGALAFDVTLWDKDKDGSATWMAWGPGVEKYAHSARLGWVLLAAERRGDVVLGEGEEVVGRLQGRVEWEDREEGRNLGRVRFQSLASSGLWVQVGTDQEGRYEVDLPAGIYRVEAGYRRGRSAEIEVGVEGGKTRQVPALFFARPPLGQTVPAGGGTTVPAGAGRTVPAGVGNTVQTRAGRWVNYDVDDGLAQSTTAAICQDREGNLWFGPGNVGNGRGLSRYDGKSFTTYSTQDGLAGNNVSAIIEDREGHLWFGAEDGVSRYDGKNFTTFTTADGLVDNNIGAILEDREGTVVVRAGNLWGR